MFKIYQHITLECKKKCSHVNITNISGKDVLNIKLKIISNVHEFIHRLYTPEEITWSIAENHINLTIPFLGKNENIYIVYNVNDPYNKYKSIQNRIVIHHFEPIETFPITLIKKIKLDDKELFENAPILVDTKFNYEINVLNNTKYAIKNFNIINYMPNELKTDVDNIKQYDGANSTTIKNIQVSDGVENKTILTIPIIESFPDKLLIIIIPVQAKFIL
ncbi:hypothetical protein AN640_08385 [Candidatus Epulonipiscium fishelsonii]|uniref:Uncharacterized protein n=1 Tax=Candidatus Epulonipiscium fishelsonii TaxID=77094 RepID=A0ACC8XD19_9FIRM|nr:hypothetical protein AN640_08385 [Epulopiscium sp. SCG-D08WGA-EpuloA1]OON95096.1 MAG: hypothetical protein ATN32_01295 [Epulopiscium sp. AS2M-Bin002]